MLHHADVGSGSCGSYETSNTSRVTLVRYLTRCSAQGSVVGQSVVPCPYTDQCPVSVEGSLCFSRSSPSNMKARLPLLHSNQRCRRRTPWAGAPGHGPKSLGQSEYASRYPGCAASSQTYSGGPRSPPLLLSAVRLTVRCKSGHSAPPGGLTLRSNSPRVERD